jgi:hypothetical protein
MRGACLALLVGLMGGAAGLAQSATAAPVVVARPVLLGSGIALGSVGGGFLARGVKGLPYSLVETTTSLRMLADGTTISNTREERIMRDSEGRERRETSMMRDGKAEVMSIFVMDPVAHTSIVLMPKMKTAHVTHMPEPKAATPEQEAKVAELRAKAEATRKDQPVQPNTEDLGAQVIAGVVVEGKRHTMVIPVGRMGNDREIKIVTETWTSPELKIVVGSSTDDPRNGKTTTVVTELHRGEPAAALFVVPADYKVQDRAVGVIGMVN